MRIARVSALAVAAVCLVSLWAPTVTAQQLLTSGYEPTAPGRVTVWYNPVDGMVQVFTDKTAGDGLTTIVLEFRLAQAPTDIRFDPSKIEWSKGLFDVATEIKMASINPDGVGRGMEDPWTVGRVLPTGLNFNELLSVLFVSGSHSNGGGLNKHSQEGPSLCCVIPEPSAWVLCGLGFLSLVGLRRRA